MDVLLLLEHGHERGHKEKQREKTVDYAGDDRAEGVLQKTVKGFIRTRAQICNRPYYYALRKKAERGGKK